MIKIKSNKIIVGDSLFDGYVYVSDGKIVEVSNIDKSADTYYDFSNKYVSSGFIDIHTHGGGGYAFVNSTADDVVNGCNFHLQYGTTSIVPTISAAKFATMEQAVSNIAQAMTDERTKTNIIGAHLEGPYLSAQQCGAQCPSFITKPNKAEYESLVGKYGNAVARWTYAPENDENGEFCKFITNNGIIASIGHSNATYKDVLCGVNNGATLVTHLYSCTSTVTRDHGFRSLGVIESAFLLNDLYVEIIADGKHLPLPLIQMICKIKGDKVCAITDCLEITGTNVTSGTMSGTDFIVEDGVCKLLDRSAFAGSVATTNVCVATLVSCGYSVPRAVQMLTEIPAKIMKLSSKGSIAVGYDADIIAFDDKINVSDVFVCGNKVK